MLVNRILKHGKNHWLINSLSSHEKDQQKTETNPLSVYISIRSTQGKALAIRWLLGASRNVRVEIWFSIKFRMVDAAKGSGDAIRKRKRLIEWQSK
uniref:Uncharacterized protein n=1 Tax=Populus trichocarpa TaxID=3694 RepID=A0A2K1Y5I8_POPTR